MKTIKVYSTKETLRQKQSGWERIAYSFFFNSQNGQTLCTDVCFNKELMLLSIQGYRLHVYNS